MYSFNAIPLQEYDQWAHFENAFSEEECIQIRSLFGGSSTEGESEAQVGSSGGVVDKKIRSTRVDWLRPSPENIWIFDRITKYVRACNEVRWKLQLNGFQEPLQITKYRDGDFYGWHQDNGPKKMSVRKLSVVVQLSHPEDYQGGELQFLGYEGGNVPKSIGSVILFPSFNPHRVTEVTKGERFSLVGWVTGEPYR